MATLGTITPDPVGQILGSPFMRFASPSGICGLAKVDGSHLVLLAVDTTAPGKGQFREFIRQAKGEYATITVLEIWNPWLEGVLTRYGFRPVEETVEGEHLTGMRWRRK